MTVAVVSKFYSRRVGFDVWEGTMLGNFIAELGSVGKLYVGNNFYRRGTLGGWFEQGWKIVEDKKCANLEWEQGCKNQF